MNDFSDLSNGLDGNSAAGATNKNHALNQILQEEQQKAALNEQIHEINLLCWDKCADKLSNKSSQMDNCMSNCVNRFVDVSLTITQYYVQKLQSSFSG